MPRYRWTLRLAVRVAHDGFDEDREVEVKLASRFSQREDDMSAPTGAWGSKLP